METKQNEDRIIRLAEQLEEYGGASVSDITNSMADLNQVSHGAASILTAAAELAGVTIVLSKVGDEARARVTR